MKVSKERQRISSSRTSLDKLKGLHIRTSIDLSHTQQVNNFFKYLIIYYE